LEYTALRNRGTTIPNAAILVHKPSLSNRFYPEAIDRPRRQML
jgi:hypothetical protein